jgi:hypothetical protein
MVPRPALLFGAGLRVGFGLGQMLPEDVILIAAIADQPLFSLVFETNRVSHSANSSTPIYFHSREEKLTIRERAHPPAGGNNTNLHK